MNSIQKRIGVYSKLEYEEKGESYLLRSEQEKIDHIIQSIHEEYGKDSIDHCIPFIVQVNRYGDSRVALFLEFFLKKK